MTDLPRSTLWPTLPLIATIQVAAFGVFHIGHALIFDPRFAALINAHRWVGSITVTIYQATLFVPACLCIWLMLGRGLHRPLLTVTALLGLYVGYYWQYPLLTGAVFALDQMDPYPVFLFDRLPFVDPLAPPSR